jgi:hypothetical protein
LTVRPFAPSAESAVLSCHLSARGEVNPSLELLLLLGVKGLDVFEDGSIHAMNILSRKLRFETSRAT